MFREFIILILFREVNNNNNDNNNKAPPEPYLRTDSHCRPFRIIRVALFVRYVRAPLLWSRVLSFCSLHNCYYYFAS